jgi:hypothetical protein
MDDTTEVNPDYRRLNPHQHLEETSQEELEIHTNFDIFIDLCFLKLDNPYHHIKLNHPDKHKEVLN